MTTKPLGATRHESRVSPRHNLVLEGEQWTESNDALMHGSTGSQHPPPLVPRSVHSMTLGHSQGRHAVQDLASGAVHQGSGPQAHLDRVESHWRSDWATWR